MMCEIHIMAQNITWFMAESVCSSLSVISRFQSKVSVPLSFSAFFKWLRRYLISREEFPVFLSLINSLTHSHVLYIKLEKRMGLVCVFLNKVHSCRAKQMVFISSH